MKEGGGGLRVLIDRSSETIIKLPPSLLVSRGAVYYLTYQLLWVMKGASSGAVRPPLRGLTAAGTSSCRHPLRPGSGGGQD